MSAKEVNQDARVNLRVIGKDSTKEFPVDVALKLLRLDIPSWELNDKNYIFENNDLKRNRSKRTDSKPKK